MKAVLSKREAKREMTREAILDAAEKLFLSHGFLGARVDDISAMTPYTKGAIYFYFKDKEDLLLAVMTRVRTVVLEPLLAALALNAASPSEALDRYLLCKARIAAEDSGKLLMTILLSIELNGTNTRSARYVSGGYVLLLKGLEAVIRSGQASGQFRTDLRAKELASLVLALEDGAMLEQIRQKRKIDGAELFRTLRAVLWAGLENSPKPDSSVVKLGVARGTSRRAK